MVGGGWQPVSPLVGPPGAMLAQAGTAPTGSKQLPETSVLMNHHGIQKRRNMMTRGKDSTVGEHGTATGTCNSRAGGPRSPLTDTEPQAVWEHPAPAPPTRSWRTPVISATIQVSADPGASCLDALSDSTLAPSNQSFTELA